MEMKVGDKVVAIWQGPRDSFPIKGRIIDKISFLFGAYFIFKGDRIESHLHNCNGRLNSACGYYVDGYGITDGMEIKPLKKEFNGLELERFHERK